MSEAVPIDPSTAPARARRSRPYLRLLWFIPSLAMLAAGLYHQYNVPDGGTINAIKLTTKQGMVGQAAEAVANAMPTTPDLYLVIATPKGEQTLQTFKDTPIGNGITWNLKPTLGLHELQRVDVWNHHTLWKDKPLDRITLGGWSTDGQMFHVDLLGEKIEPPKWAMPVAIVGGTLTLVALLRFVWDQVI
jgi:hypothetical protein